MISPVGLTMIQTCASVRAGINRFVDFEDYLCEPEELDFGDPEPLKGSRVPVLGLDDERLSRLLLWALQELVQNTRMTRSVFARVKIYVALPPAGRARRAEGAAASDLLEFLEKALRIDRARVGLFPGGHTASARAMEAALAEIAREPATPCIIAGVDSYHDPDTLALLDRAGRLRSKKNPNGFIPGEAASALLVESRATAIGRGARVLTSLRGIRSSREANVIDSDLPSAGAGLAEAIRTLPGLEDRGAVIEWVACDLNGERYRHHEWGLCQVNLCRLFGTLQHVWHPADCLGDVGAASGSVILALIARAFDCGYAPARECVVWMSADDGERAAMLLAGP